MTEEYCGAITHATRGSCSCRLASSVLEFGFPLDSIIYIYIYMYICVCVCNQFRFAQNLSCATPFGTQLLRMSGSVCSINHKLLPLVYLVTLFGLRNLNIVEWEATVNGEVM
jgi:hypothetical protein